MRGSYELGTVRSAAVTGGTTAADLAGTPAADVFARQVESLRRLLDQLGEHDWDAHAAPTQWSVHALVAHLLVIEHYTAHVLGADPLPAQLHVGTCDHSTMGADVIEAELVRRPGDTADDWFALARRNAAFGATVVPADDAPAPLHDWPFTRSSALVARAFEIWTHADDIRRATGRPMATPVHGDLRTMSSFLVGSLPLLVGKAMRPVRIVLSGQGGASFELGGPGRPAAELQIDVVDYCRMAARRVAPSALVARRQGDVALLDALLVAATAFAV
jgi:uncharacterized protein (TIGR03083 family)